jgi:GT2 family glycosyltransferase
VNQGVRASKGEHVLVMHDDAEPREPGWLEAMLELSVQPGVGAVGAKLYYSHGALQHIGLLAGVNGVFGRPFQGFAPETVGYFSAANCIRNYTAVSAACLMTRREVWDRIGGFDEALFGPAADLDYGLRVGEAGWRVVFTPYARLTHHESGGISQRPLSAAEHAHLVQRWGPRLDVDPYYNPNLSRAAVDYRVDPAVVRRS